MNNEQYDSTFFLGEIVISDENQLYLYVSYLSDRIESTVYRAKGPVNISAFSTDDFESTDSYYSARFTI